MIKLARHLWDQLINDEDAAKHWLTGAKTAGLAFSVQVGIATAGDIAKALAWGKAQWFAVIVATLIAAGAKVADPVVVGFECKAREVVTVGPCPSYASNMTGSPCAVGRWPK